MRLSEAIEVFMYHKAATCAPGTVADYGRTMAGWLEFLGEDPQVVTLEAHHAQRYLYHLRIDRGLAPKTIKNAHIGLSAFFTWAEAEIGIPHVMRGRVPAPKAPPAEIRPLSRLDVRALLAACDRSAPSSRIPDGIRRVTRLRDRAIVLTLLDTGARATELCNLTIGDLDMANGSIAIRRGKGGKGRSVYVGAIARHGIARYLSGRQFREDTDPLYITQKGGPMDRDMLGKMLSKAGRRADIADPVRPHRLRHTFAITYLRNGGDVFTLQRLLGHSTIDMVKRYLAIASVDIAAAHRRASPVDGWRLG